MSIKKLKKTTTFSLPRLKLFKKDLVFILSTLQNNNISFVNFLLDGYNLNSIEDLEELELKESKSFFISASQRIKIEIGDRNLVEINYNEDSVSIGVATLIHDYLIKKRNHYLIAAISIVIPIIFVNLYFILTHKTETITTIVFLSSIPISILLHLYLEFSFASKIIFIENLTFFQRNMDRIILGIIMALIGAIFGSIGTLLIK